MNSEQTASFPEMEPLLAGMLAHRGRVVAQIAGVPAAAMQAALGDGAVDPAHQASVEASARAAGEGAKQSFVMNLLQALLPRKPEQAKTEPHAMAGRGWQRAPDKSGPMLADAMKLNEDDRAFLMEHDRTLLSAMVARGYFDLAHGVWVRSLEADQILEGSGPEAHFIPKNPGLINMVSDRMGDFIAPLPADSRQRQALAQEWATGQVPANQVEQTYRRWLVLLHEAAHCDFPNQAAPFTPTAGRVDDASLQALNRWIFGGLAMPSRGGGQLLNENHSDTMAAMLLLEATGHDPRAIGVIEDWATERRLEMHKLEQGLLDDDGQATGGGLRSCHSTHLSLARVLDTREQWQGLPAAQLRERARQIASDGVLDLLDPDRVNAQGWRMGPLIGKQLLPMIDKAIPVGALMLAMTRCYVANQDPKAWLTERFGDHPAVKPLLTTWDGVLPGLRTFLSRPLEPGSTDTHADAVRRSDPRALVNLSDVLSRIPMVCQAGSSELFEGVREAFRADRAALEKALVQTRTAPSMEAWRQGRRAGGERHIRLAAP